MHEFSRTEMLLGTTALNKLKKAHIAVIGVGGVGSFTIEALARSAIGKLTLVDDDRICLTNINRQIMAYQDNVGSLKVSAMAERVRKINNEIIVNEWAERFVPDTAADFFDRLAEVDCVVDAIDTVSAKIALIETAQKRNVPVISSMGTGNKLDPTKFKVADIYDTSNCPLARVMRRELRARGVERLKVIYSPEVAAVPFAVEKNDCRSNCICPEGSAQHCLHKNQVPASIAFVPSVAGLIIAGEVIKDIIGR